jgi:hypothetical protein
MTTTGVSRFKKSNCHYLCTGEIQSGEGDVNTIGEGSCVVLAGAKETKM